MIHLLEKKLTGYNPNDDSLLHYVELSDIIRGVLGNTYNEIVYTNIECDTYFDYSKLDNYIKSNKINVLIMNLEILQHFQNDGITIIHKLSHNYKNIKFIVSSFETYPTIDLLNFKTPNVFYILSGFHNTDVFTDLKIVNYYKLNLYFQNDYNKFIHKLFYYISKMRRSKKYNFFNGVHKPHRIKCYEIIKNIELMDDGYFSYLDFAEFLNDETQYNQFIKFLGMDTVDEYLEYISNFEIPYLCDTYEVSQNIFVPFTIPPQYSFQSYVSITTETNFIEDKSIILSEKSFKAFHSFNIPLIFGMPMVNEYLSNMGFDMFADLFDVTPKFTKEEMYQQFENNANIIKNMSIEELHQFYLNNLHRIEHNFINLIELQKNIDFHNIHNFING
jgi:hypothetical protein